MLLDRFGQSNKFWKKSSKKSWDLQVWVFWRSSRGHPENVLGTSRINLPGTSLQRQIRTSTGCHFRMSPGRQMRRPRDVRLGSPWDGQMGSLREALGMLEGDDLRTSWGPIFAGWVVSTWKGEGGLLTKYWQAWTGGGGSQIFKFVWTSFMDYP